MSGATGYCVRWAAMAATFWKMWSPTSIRVVALRVYRSAGGSHAWPASAGVGAAALVGRRLGEREDERRHAVDGDDVRHARRAVRDAELADELAGTPLGEQPALAVGRLLDHLGLAADDEVQRRRRLALLDDVRARRDTTRRRRSRRRSRASSSPGRRSTARGRSRRCPGTARSARPATARGGRASASGSGGSGCGTAGRRPALGAGLRGRLADGDVVGMPVRAVGAERDDDVGTELVEQPRDVGRRARRRSTAASVPSP